MASKKRKHSGLDSHQLQVNYDRLLSLQKTLLSEDIVSDDQSELADQIARTIAMLESRLESPEVTAGHVSQHHSSLEDYSGATDDTLQKIGLTRCGQIIPCTDVNDKLAQFTARGSESLWSAENFHKQLIFLQRSTEACARARIHLFMFRAAAMLEDKCVVMNLEHKISNTPNLLNSFIDYTAMACSDKDFARSFLKQPSFDGFDYLPGIFIVEVKVKNPQQHVPQALCEMYASLKQLKKQFIRGAVTNGLIWVFLHLTLGENSQGGQYYQSDPIDLQPGFDLQGNVYLREDSADYIAAFLSSWMGNHLADVDPPTDGLLDVIICRAS